MKQHRKVVKWQVSASNFTAKVEEGMQKKCWRSGKAKGCVWRWNRCSAGSLTSQAKTWSTKYAFLTHFQIGPMKKRTNSGQWWHQTHLKGDTCLSQGEVTKELVLLSLDTAHSLCQDCPFGGLAVRQTHIHPTSCSKCPLQVGGFLLQQPTVAIHHPFRMPNAIKAAAPEFKSFLFYVVNQPWRSCSWNTNIWLPRRQVSQRSPQSCWFILRNDWGWKA